MKWTFLLTSIVFINFCENKKKHKTFSILTNKKVFIPGDTLKISLKKNYDLEFDSISYFKDDKKIDSIHEIGKKLGDKKITAKIFKNNNFIHIKPSYICSEFIIYY